MFLDGAGLDSLGRSRRVLPLFPTRPASMPYRCGCAATESVGCYRTHPDENEGPFSLSADPEPTSPANAENPPCGPGSQIERMPVSITDGTTRRPPRGKTRRQHELTKIEMSLEHPRTGAAVPREVRLLVSTVRAFIR